MARPALVLSALVLIAASCGVSRASGPAEPQPGSASTTIEDYPDAQTRALRRLAAAPRPVPNSALPPRHFDAERFPDSLVERHLIVSGGVEPDGIPPVDEPWFEPVAEVDWLDDAEPVLALTVGDDARAYPVQVMILHEIVNDFVGEVPVTITYCPLCNSAVAFDRRAADGVVLDFGVSGALYQSALVMYDRQSESLWTHFDGRAVVGDRVGQSLDLVPVSTVAWADFATSNPDGQVLGRVDPRLPYGLNPYGSYEDRDGPLPGFFTGEIDSRLDPMARVVGVQLDGAETAVSLDRLRQERVVIIDDETIDGAGVRDRIVVFWVPGATAALDENRVDEGIEIGATGAFRTERILVAEGDSLVDSETGDRWDVLGRPIGPGDAEPLDPVAHLDTFWFAWSTYHSETTLVG